MRTQLVIAALLAVALAPTASAAAPPEPECAQVYQELTDGPVAVTLVNACTVRIEVTGVGGGCAERHQEYDFGTVHYESESTCHYRIEVGPAYPDAGAFAPSVDPQIDCYAIANEWTVGPVTIHQRSSCSYGVSIDGIAFATSGPACSDIHNQWTAGPVTVTQYSSCEYGVEFMGNQVYPVTA